MGTHLCIPNPLSTPSQHSNTRAHTHKHTQLLSLKGEKSEGLTQIHHIDTRFEPLHSLVSLNTRVLDDLNRTHVQTQGRLKLGVLRLGALRLEFQMPIGTHPDSP